MKKFLSYDSDGLGSGGEIYAQIESQTRIPWLRLTLLEKGNHLLLSSAEARELSAALLAVADAQEADK